MNDANARYIFKQILTVFFHCIEAEDHQRERSSVTDSHIETPRKGNFYLKRCKLIAAWKSQMKT